MSCKGKKGLEMDNNHTQSGDLIHIYLQLNPEILFSSLGTLVYLLKMFYRYFCTPPLTWSWSFIAVIRIQLASAHKKWW